MTGYGEGRSGDATTAIRVEIRAVNARHFKLHLRTPDGYSALEPRIEAAVKKRLKRGSLSIVVREDRSGGGEPIRIHAAALLSYRKQVVAALASEGLGDAPSIDALLALPGVVVDEGGDAVDVDKAWAVVAAALETALDAVDAMRRAEGAAMQRDLAENCRQVADELSAIAERTPGVVTQYRDRLLDRVRQLTAGTELPVTPADLAREVALFADRCDVSEEMVRLRSHLQQFEQIIAEEAAEASGPGADGAGRKLDFLTQEMFREANTIGSKANDATIARHVVQIKALIERMREMVQNVE